MIIANEKARSSGGWSTCAALIAGRSDIEVRLLGRTSVEEAVRDAVALGCATIVAAGGDGTISSVVDAMLKQAANARLGILPVGTFNHFAKDLNIPLEPQEALSVIDEGHTRLIDIARVNDRHFLNNSSVGMYLSLSRLAPSSTPRRRRWITASRRPRSSCASSARCIRGCSPTSACSTTASTL